ncbi:MAG TPA: succinate--CoA ligase [Clostridiales bacterium UBA8153]|nr:succinate--CoA ligase [Clostridiales bacterium UBA8153]
MKLFEWEAKAVFREHGLPVPRGRVVKDPEEAAAVAQELGRPVVVKAQVLSGGRGKAGGINFAGDPAAAQAAAARLLGMMLAGEPVRSVLVEERLDIAREFYLSVTIDPALPAPVLMVSGAGGIDIEKQAATTPQLVFTQPVEIARGLQGFQVWNLLADAGLPPAAMHQGVTVATELFRLFRQRDAELAEINPLALTTAGSLVAADAKLIINDNALFRQPWVPRTRAHFDHDLEYEAAQHGLNYVKLSGSIGLLCTGAGLSLATLDLVAREGARAANFLESGGANYRNAYHGLRLVLGDPEVKVLLINTFGLVSRADVICRGLADALKELGTVKPVVAAIRGTGEEEARRIFWEELGIASCPDTESAVRKAVKMAREAQ